VLKKLGKYEIIGQVGRGAMGEVYKAHDPSIGRLVALKTITSSLLGNPELLDRFYREARSAGALQHPNIVTVYELGVQEDIPFIAMEFVEGETLEKIIESHSPLSLLQKAGFIVAICRALDYAHKHGVVHRDIKPGNIMLTKDGNVKVVDFGIARVADALQTQTHTFMGTLGYMPPEQIRGKRADERSDIWALGITFYELLCYQRPFEGDNHAALMMNIVDANLNPTPIAELAPDCPPALESLVGKMLRKDSGERYQTMEEVLFDAEPLWKDIQLANVSKLVADSEVAIGAQDFSRARDLLRQSLRIDNLNDRAKSLLDEVNAEFKRRETILRIQTTLDHASELLKEGHLQEAKAEAEGALALDGTFVLAIELLAEIERLSERRRLIRKNLQAAKQLLVEGALAEAAECNDEVLKIDDSNTEARALKIQIEEHAARREERKRREEILQRARQFWAEQRLADCVILLTEAQKEFPGDSDIAKQLAAAKEELAEQEKQKQLAEARKLAADQRFDEALRIVDSLLSQKPADQDIRKSHAGIRVEKENWLREQKFQAEIVSIESLLNAEKFSEAASRGEKLSKQFSGRAELTNVLRSAHAGMAQFEERRQLAEALQTVRKKMNAGKFRDAVSEGEKALVRFPRDPDLAAMLSEGRAKQKDLENREALRKRIGEIQKNIKRGQHTDAVDLARQTIAALGADTEVEKLLRVAELELEDKRKKIEEREKRLCASESLLKEGHLDAALQLLRESLDTKVLSKKDQRVQQLLNEIQQRKAMSPPPGAAPYSQPSQGSPSNYDAATDRALHQDALNQPIPSVSSDVQETDQDEGTFSATIVIDSSTKPASPITFDFTESSYALENRGRAPDNLTTPAMASHEDANHSPVPRWVPLAITAVSLILLILAVSYFILQKRSRDEIALRDLALRLEQQKNWPEALREYEILARRGGALSGLGLERVRSLGDLLDQERSLLKNAQDDEVAGKLSEAKLLYQQAANLHGDREQAALDAVMRLSNEKQRPGYFGTHGKSATPGKVNPSIAPRSADSKTSEAKLGDCQLIPTDIASYLSMAERNRARGNYADAEREYNDVLSCDPANERALAGLTRTKEAKALPNRGPT
jgi:eukaryotic-like serine/threonine-protein kinase